MPRRNKVSPLTTVSRSALAFILSAALLPVVFSDGRQQSKTQEMPKPQGPPQSGGASTGGVFAPVMDEKHRPITAGGFVDGAPVIFEDVTKKSGLDNFRHVSGSSEKNLILEAPGSGVAIFDYDNDGWPDIYLVNGATFDDYDGDGKLDLYVTGYVKFDLNHPPIAGTAATQYSFCQYRGKPVMCGPRGLPGEHNHLFRNNGDGTFTEVSQTAGVANEKGYYGFGVAFADVNDDGKLDIAVANDSVPNYLFLNKGDGTFEDASYPSGFALKDDGREQAAMGLGIGDYDNSGHLSLYVTTFSDDYYALYK